MKTLMYIVFLAVVLCLQQDAAAQEEYLVWDDSISCLMQTSNAMHLPVEHLKNKIREGRAKKKSTAEIFTALKVRQKLLVQLRETEGGTLRNNYTRKLFKLERKAQQQKTSATIRNNGNGTMSSTVAGLKKIKTIKPTTVSDSGAVKKNTSLAGTSKRADKSDRKMDKKLKKVEARAEKKLKKVEERTKKRMEALQKKAQKRALKQFKIK